MFDKSSGLSIYNKIKRNSRLAIELALCSQRDDLQGIYLSPSFTNPQTWFGLIYVRYGVYSRASYRFIIIMGNDQYDPTTMKFPINHEKQSATKNSSSSSSSSQNHENRHSYWRLPRIFFYGPTKPYHPHIHPTTGELNLGWYFKEWDEKRHHIWHCLKCLKHLFYSKLGKSDLNVEVGTLDNQNLQNPQNPKNPQNLQNLAESKINSHRIPPITEIKSQNTLLEPHNQQQKPLEKMPSNSSENSSASNTSHNNPHNPNGISRNYSTTSSGTSNTNSNTNPPHHTSNTHHHHLPHLHPQTQNSKTLFNETAATVYQTNHEEFKQAVQFNIERTRNELDTIPVVTDDLFEPNYSTLESDNIYLVAKNKMKIAGEKHKLTGWQAQNAQTSGHSFVMPGTIRPFSKR